MKQFFQKIINNAFENAFSKPVNELLDYIKIKVDKNQSMNMFIAPLTTTSVSGFSGGTIGSITSSGFNGMATSMVLEASEKHTLNRPCSFNIKLYHATGGYVAEISKYSENEKAMYNPKPGGLHILNSEHFGEQLEKAIAYEGLRQ